MSSSTRQRTLLAVLLVPWLSSAALAARTTLNLFEWIGVSPLVVAAEIQGEEGKHTVLRTRHVVRGDLAGAADLLLDLRQANRDRDRENDPRALRLELGTTYVLLLDDAEPRRDGRRVFRLVRGVRGARELPAEGAQPILDALDRFAQIQDRKDEAWTWSSFAAMLEAGQNDVLLEAALDQYLKFRRGLPGDLPRLLPLIDHPSPVVRGRSAALAGQIVAAHGSHAVPDETALRDALFARARRDPEVDVRVAACDAVGEFDDLAALELLRQVAADDPDQNVRYVAEKLLYERRLRARAGSGGR